MDQANVSRKKGLTSPKGRGKKTRGAAKKGASDMGLRVMLEAQRDSQRRAGQMEDDMKKLRDIVQASLVKSVKRGDAIDEIKRTLSWLKEEQNREKEPAPKVPEAPPVAERNPSPAVANNEMFTSVKPEKSRAPYMKFIEGKGRRGYRDSSRKPILQALPKDYLSVVLVMRWIEFLLERVVRDKISLVLDYYKDIGWISEDVKSTVMSYARGENQDVMAMGLNLGEFEPPEIQLPPSRATEYRRVDDWRLTAEDHLKSLLFVQMIAGIPVDKDRLSSLEQVIKKVKFSLEGFHSV